MERERGVAGIGNFQIRTECGKFLVENRTAEMVCCRCIRVTK